MLDAGVDLRDVQIAARHADPRTTMRYDRARTNLDPPPELHPGRLHVLGNLIRPRPPGPSPGRRPAGFPCIADVSVFKSWASLLNLFSKIG